MYLFPGLAVYELYFISICQRKGNWYIKIYFWKSQIKKKIIGARKITMNRSFVLLVILESSLFLVTPYGPREHNWMFQVVAQSKQNFTLSLNLHKALFIRQPIHVRRCYNLIYSQFALLFSSKMLRIKTFLGIFVSVTSLFLY